MCHPAVLEQAAHIDNAHTGGQSAFSSESNKLVLCSALRPAQHAALAISAFGFDRAKEVLRHDSLEGGGLRLAERLPVLSDGGGPIPGLRRLLASSRMGSSSIPVVYRAPLWPALGCYVVQQALQIQQRSGTQTLVPACLSVL